MILVCAMSSLSLRERVSAEQTGEGLAPATSDSSPSSVASRDTFSLREKVGPLFSFSLREKVSADQTDEGLTYLTPSPHPIRAQSSQDAPC